MNIIDIINLILPVKHIESLPAKNKKIYVVRYRDNDYLLACNGEVEYYLLLRQCTDFIPEINFLFSSRSCIAIEHLRYETVADRVLLYLMRGELAETRRLVYDVGRSVALFHSQLASCRRARSSLASHTLEEIIKDRCRLALLIKDYRYIVKKICRVMAESLKSYTAEPCRTPIGHGDLHLYQILTDKNRIVYIDPGPEPYTRTMPCLEYDIVSLIRSIEYVGHMIATLSKNNKVVAEDLAAVLLSGYRGERPLPDKKTLELLYLARTIYEHYYDYSNRTGFESIPLSSLKAYLLEGSTLIGRLVSHD